MIAEERAAVLNAELDRLNQAVKDAETARRKWMNDHMVDYAKYKIGEMIYDLKTGRELGVVTKHYRYWTGRNTEYDTSMDIEYEYKTRSGSFDNTSRQPDTWVGNLDEKVAQAESTIRLAKFTRADGGIDWGALFGGTKE